MSTLALRGGEPIRKKPWPTWPVFDEREEKNLLAVLHGGQWYNGPMIAEFQRRYACFQDAKHGIACANGTVAIEASLLAVGVGYGDEVITTPFTFVATTSSILRVNALPVYADVDELTGNLDPDDVEARITPRTAAIVPVHVGGRPADIDRFTEIGERHGLPVVYDAAHGWGSQWRGKGVGAFGALNTYSFQASKNITSGEGGMILTNDDRMADLAYSYVNCGRKTDGGWYEHMLVGANLRASEFGCALLLAQIERLEEQTLQRQTNGRLLANRLRGIPGIRLADDDERITRRSYHLFTFCYDQEEWLDVPRERFLQALQAEGIPAAKVWPLMYRMPLFDPGSAPKSCPALTVWPEDQRPDYRAIRLPQAERLSDTTGVWITQATFLAEPDGMGDIADAIGKVRDNINELASL